MRLTLGCGRGLTEDALGAGTPVQLGLPEAARSSDRRRPHQPPPAHAMLRGTAAACGPGLGTDWCEDKTGSRTEGQEGMESKRLPTRAAVAWKRKATHEARLGENHAGGGDALALTDSAGLVRLQAGWSSAIWGALSPAKAGPGVS